ncbi:unnamed protein product [Lactuca saligna]|uniref:Non-specific lipid-transfer protein n=1 Tax=Lactuca saligna TaxID=75948 RepID=A0AA35V0T4_LACSI|nr:unnamed protein product [Lactuca saligna]
MARMLTMVLCVVATCMVVAAPYAEADISCRQVIKILSPCIDYLTEGGGVSTVCCNGVRALNNAANTTCDRQMACRCLKSASAENSGINPINAASLPHKCRVNIPYKISRSTNCTQVQ